MTSVTTQTSPSLSATRSRSASGGIAASPLWRSTSATARSLDSTEDGSLLVTKTLGMGRIGGTGATGGMGRFLPACPACPAPLVSVSVRQTIPAVIAADRGFDETRAVFVATAKERESHMARMKRGPRVRRTGRASGAGVARDRLTNHLAKLLIIHRD